MPEENQDSEENSLPPSLQEPTEPASKNGAYSEPTEALSEAPEGSPDDFPSKSTDIAPSNSTQSEAENEPKTEEKQAQNEPVSEPILESPQAPEPETAQTPVNEPLEEPKTETPETQQTEARPEPETKEPEPESEKEKPRISYLKSQKLGELLVLARNAIQSRKRKKLDRVMSLFSKQSKITNDEVEKLLHVSDATATRYLSILEREGKIQQSGKTGKGVSYLKI